MHHQRTSITANEKRHPLLVPDVMPTFAPSRTVRCVGPATFRNQAVRDAGCLLDIDPSVSSWTCTPCPIEQGSAAFLADFEVTRGGFVELLAVTDAVEGWVTAAALAQGTPLKTVAVSDLAGVRLENASELLRYADWRVSLSDRVRLLAFLDSEGSLTLAEAMTAIRAADPIGVIAALALRRFVDLDVDSGRIGPETRIARWRD